MSSKENIILLLKELEQEIIALEEEIVKKTENEVNETIAEFTYTIKKETRKAETDIVIIQNKLAGLYDDYKPDVQISSLKLAHLTWIQDSSIFAEILFR